MMLMAKNNNNNKKKTTRKDHRQTSFGVRWAGAAQWLWGADALVAQWGG